jgi:hypothetical protein
MRQTRDAKTEIAERLRATAEDLVDLVAAQVKLLRVELLGDVRSLSTRLVRVAVFLPLLCIGYAFVAGAGAFALGTVIGFGWSFAAIGLVHALAGAAGLIVASRALRETRVLDRSRDELARTLETVPAAITAPAPAIEAAAATVERR